jgi:VIT1/CCC1 family predicted Fe2+/Mn2+ transporter
MSLSVVGLFVIGVLKTLCTGRPWWRSGLEMVGIGSTAAVTRLYPSTVNFWSNWPART